MDIQMLGPDRPGATEQIRALSAARWASTPFIVLTANAMQGVREKCLAVRMDEIRVQTY
jgi:CheY-like chemotaxis protein